MTAGLTAILPVKRWSDAKSRLDVNHTQRSALAKAFSIDVIAALTECDLVSHIVAVTNEAALARERPSERTFVLWHRNGPRSTGLCEAVNAGISWAKTHRPDSPLIVVPADLPALNRETLRRAIEVISIHERAFVPDHDGLGTTVLYGRKPVLLRPAYGRGSASSHRALGYVPCPSVDSSVRLDVDTVEDLREALALGAGPETVKVCSTLRS